MPAETLSGIYSFHSRLSINRSNLPIDGCRPPQGMLSASFTVTYTIIMLSAISSLSY
jgi:hypothetical protein